MKLKEVSWEEEEEAGDQLETAIVQAGDDGGQSGAGPGVCGVRPNVRGAADWMWEPRVGGARFERRESTLVVPVRQGE